MPTSGFEVRGRIVRQRSARFAKVRRRCCHGCCQKGLMAAFIWI
jgi:hypothetical protein